MKRALTATLLVVLALAWTMAAHAQGSNPCIAKSETNCTVASGGPPLTITVTHPSDTWPNVAINEEVLVIAEPAPSELPGLMEVTSNDESCLVTTEIFPLASGPDTGSIISNWWQVSGAPYTGGGLGLTATFTPTNYGTGSLAFYLTYSNCPLCGGTTTVSITNSFTVDASNANIIIDLPPVIVTQPQNQYGAVGCNASFSVSTSLPTLPSVSSGSLQLWLEGNAGVVTNSTGQVTEWDDQSINTNDAFQSSANNQPALAYPSAIGGMPAVRFNGVQDNVNGDYLYGAGQVSLTNAFTYFVLYNAFSTTNIENVRWLAGEPGDTYGSCRIDMITYGDTHFSIWAYDWDFPFEIPTNTYRIAIEEANTNLNQVSLIDISATNSIGFNVAISNTQPVGPGYYVGGLNPSVGSTGTGRNFNGDIAELLCYSGSLSQTDLFAVAGYLQQKYLDLPSYQWMLNGTIILGATNATLTITNAQVSNFGTYSVIVSNLDSTTVSSNAVLALVTVASLSPTNNTNCLLMSSNATLQIWAIPASTNVGATNLELIAASSPYLPATNLPDGWSLNGSRTNITYVNIESPGNFTVICSDGTSAITNIIVVTPNGDLTNWQDGKLRWVCSLPFGYATNLNGSGIDSSPAIGPDGTIYVTVTGNILYAVDPSTGTIKWTNNDGAWTGQNIVGLITSSPVVGSNGTIYFATDQGYLFAVSTNGNTLWTNYVNPNNGIYTSPAIDADGTLYVNSCTAVNSGGTTIWSFPEYPLSLSSTVIGPDCEIYFTGTYDNELANGLTALSHDGYLNWIFEEGVCVDCSPYSPLIPSPAIDFAGTIYSSTGFQWISAANPNGTQKWLFGIDKIDGGINDSISSSIAVGSDGTVYFGALDDSLYAVSNGVLRWVLTNAAGGIVSTPSIGADGTIYFGSLGSNFYAVTNGNLKWVCTNATGTILSSPAIGMDGTVYFGSEDGNLYAVYGSAPLDTNSPWPMFQRNPQHTASQSGSTCASNCVVPILFGGCLDLSAPEDSPETTITFSIGGPPNTSWDVFMSEDMVNWNFYTSITLSGSGTCAFSYIDYDSTNYVPTAFFYLSTSNAGGCCSRVIGFDAVTCLPGELVADPFYESSCFSCPQNIYSGLSPMNTLNAVFENQDSGRWWEQLDQNYAAMIGIWDESSVGIFTENNGIWQDESGTTVSDVTLLPGQAAQIMELNNLPIVFAGLVAPPGLVTNHIVSGTNYLSSILPKAGRIKTDLNFTNASLGDQVFIWEPNIGNYVVYTCEDSVSQHWSPGEPYLNLAQGFILVTTNATSWIQEIPACPGQSSSSCVYSSVTNCSSGSGAPLALSPGSLTNFPWALTGQSIQATAALTASAPGLMVNIITNESCIVTTNVLLPVTAVATNWWQVSGPGTDSEWGTGLTASFAPSSCGAGTVTFHIVYTNTSSCATGVSSVALTNTFDVLAIGTLTPTNGVGCSLITSNATYQAYAVATATNSPSNIAVVATSCPALTGAGFPPFWSLNGLQTNVTYVSTAVPATYTVIYTLGSSSITNVYYVIDGTNTALNVSITEPINNSNIP